MFSSVGVVEAFRTLASSSAPSLPCLNSLTQLLPVAHDRGPSPYVPYISSLNPNMGFSLSTADTSNCSILDFLYFPSNTKHINLKSMGKYNKRFVLQDAYAEHVKYSTYKISSSYLLVFCVRLKTFQPPLVRTDCRQSRWFAVYGALIAELAFVSG